MSGSGGGGGSGNSWTVTAFLTRPTDERRSLFVSRHRDAADGSDIEMATDFAD